jgi:hypothetical protein
MVSVIAVSVGVTVVRVGVDVVPGTERSGQPVLGDLATADGDRTPDLGQNFLGHFLGLGRVTEHGQGQPVDRTGQLREDLLEGAALPAGHGGDELVQVFGIIGH